MKKNYLAFQITPTKINKATRLPGWRNKPTNIVPFNGKIFV